MNRRFVFLLLISACLVLIPFRSPAPLIYTPGEGFTYEPYGSEGRWRRDRAKDQLIVAQGAFDQKDYSTALKAARRVVKTWPLSEYSAQAQYLVGRCYEQKESDEHAFKEYQKLLEKYPKAVNYDDVLNRQYEIANRFLSGQWFKVFDVVPFFPSMEKTAGMYETIVKNGPYSEIAPHAQLKVGEAREKQRDFPNAVKAYELAADRYNDRSKIAADALYREAYAYYKQAATAEYDQNTAAQAIAIFNDFMELYPNDPRVPEAVKMIAALKIEQARGNFETAKFYEKKAKWRASQIYYNEVVYLLQDDPNSPYAVQARERLDEITKKLQTAVTQASTQ
jgi:outer membrane protein assembly factor BamD